MSVNEDSLLSGLVHSAPPAELPGVAKSLGSLASGNSVVSRALQDFIDDKGGVFSDKYVALKYNRQPLGKYIDYVRKQLFTADPATGKAVDIEEWNGDVDYPPYFDELVTKLDQYGQDHFPLNYAYAVIPDEDTTIVLIYGRRVNGDNFYTGQWSAEYAVSAGQVTGDVNLDVHYYEDGNVRLGYLETVSESLSNASGSAIVNAIERGENAATAKILAQFGDLNQRVFKNLRRLLPVTRAKINWGSAIGNYRLGLDVVHGS